MEDSALGTEGWGILPEKVKPWDLPAANGIFLMFTFLAIIFGVVLAGALKDLFEGRVWIASLACVAIAIIGTTTSLLVRRLPLR